MTTADLIVVGAGFAGSYAAQFARRRGVRVTVIDDARPDRASRCAAALVNEAWCAKLGGLAEEGFRAWAEWLRPPRVEIGGRTFWHVTPRSVLVPADVKGTVAQASSGGVRLTTGEWISGRVVYVAAGVHAAALAGVPVTPRYGAALWFRKPAGYRPRVELWAPYRHQMTVLHGDRAYFGDGNALKHWSPERLRQTRERAAAWFSGEPTQSCVGARPYCEGGPAFGELDDGVWVGSGLAKFGSLVGAAFARRLMEEL